MALIQKIIMNWEEQNVEIVQSQTKTELYDYEILTNLPTIEDIMNELNSNWEEYFQAFRTQWHLYQSQYEQSVFYLSLYSSYGRGAYKWYRIYRDIDWHYWDYSALWPE